MQYQYAAPMRAVVFLVMCTTISAASRLRLEGSSSIQMNEARLMASCADDDPEVVHMEMEPHNFSTVGYALDTPYRALAYLRGVAETCGGRRITTPCRPMLPSYPPLFFCVWTGSPGEEVVLGPLNPTLRQLGEGDDVRETWVVLVCPAPPLSFAKDVTTSTVSLSVRHFNASAISGRAIPWAGVPGGDTVRVPTAGMVFSSCSEIQRIDPVAVDGTYTIAAIPGVSEPRQIYCDMTRMGGGWTLVSVIGSGDDPTFEKRYPNLGLNAAKLASNAEDDFSSVSKAEFNSLFRNGPEAGGSATLKVEVLQRGTLCPLSYQACANSFYLYQKLNGVGTFDAFRAVRDASLWGTRASDYKTCADSSAPCNYDASSHSFASTDGGEMKYWEYYTYTVNGESARVGRHGIPGDMTSGCEWVQYHKYLTRESAGYGTTQAPTYSFCDVANVVKLWIK